MRRILYGLNSISGRDGSIWTISGVLIEGRTLATNYVVERASGISYAQQRPSPTLIPTDLRITTSFSPHYPVIIPASSQIYLETKSLALVWGLRAHQLHSPQL